MAVRSPPRLSRWRWVGPLLAGIGAAPHSCAKAAWGVQPVGVVPEGGQELSSDFGADAGQPDQAWGGCGHQRAELGIGLADLLAQVLVPASEAAQCGLGGVHGVGDVAGGSQPRAGCDQGGRGQGAQLFAQLLRGGDQQRLELIGGLAPALSVNMGDAPTGA